MRDVCDPRKTGCDCYPFPHRRNSHPGRLCAINNGFNWTTNLPDTQAWLDAAYRQVYSAFAIPPDLLKESHRPFKCVLIPVLKQDE